MKWPTNAVILLGLALGAGRAAEEKPTPGATPVCESPSRTAAISLKDPFPDVLGVAQDLANQLQRLKEQDRTVSPATLFEQARAEKKANVHPLPAPGTRLDAAALYARVRPGVVVVFGLFKCDKCKNAHANCASGFVVRADGLIVTNYHVIEGYRNMEAVGIATHDGHVFPVKAVLAGNRLRDLALLQADAKDLQPLPLASSVATGTTVYCLSHPGLAAGRGSGFYMLSQGIVGGMFTLRTARQERFRMLAITAEYGPGSSGGPILNDHGAVVGIACQAQSVSRGDGEKGASLVWRLARPAGDLLALLAETEPSPRPGTPR